MKGTSAMAPAGRTAYRSSAAAANAVVNCLVDYITGHKLGDGQPLPSVRDLAQAWGHAPSAVRDGLLRAETLGLVEVRPRSGVLVRLPDYASVVETLSKTLAFIISNEDPHLVHLWDARTAIETEAAYRAARRRLPEDLVRLRRCLQEADRQRENRPRFVAAEEAIHLIIARIAGNPVLETFLDTLLKILRPERLRIIPSAGSLEAACARHEGIYAAIADGDAERAARCMEEHCRRNVRNLLALGEATEPAPAPAAHGTSVGV